MIKKIMNFFRKKKEISYPNDFAIIRFTEVAFESGITDDSNKVIERYYYDENGNLKKKMYKYSPERVSSLRNVLGVSVYDKTEKELEFPIIGKIELGVVKFKSKSK